MTLTVGVETAKSGTLPDTDVPQPVEEMRINTRMVAERGGILTPDGLVPEQRLLGLRVEKLHIFGVKFQRGAFTHSRAERWVGQSS